MPMKSIRNTLNIVLSAIIVALGFGSCVSHRAYQVPLSNFHIWGKWGYYNFIIIYNYNYI